MALDSVAWLDSLKQVVRLDSEKIWVPLAEVRELKPTLFELVYNPSFLRQGLQRAVARYASTRASSELESRSGRGLGPESWRQRFLTLVDSSSDCERADLQQCATKS